jgi:O-6-methylguanine DNA methyltransferase
MRVYALAAKIPRSKVATYGQLARLAGNPKAARAVGSLMKYNPDKKIVPCHRVVAQDGKLTGYSFGRGIATKRSVLIKEGVSFLGDRIDLSISGWRRGKKL